VPRALQDGLQPVQPNPVSAEVDANKSYSVLLSNGSVYFGKLEGLGSVRVKFDGVGAGATAGRGLSF
jgi:hypothetical protein